MADDTEETIHETRRQRSRRAIASYFRRVADALGRGEPVPAGDDQTVTVEPPAKPELDIEVEREGGDISLEIELEWPEDEGGDVDTEAQASKATFEVYEDTIDDWRWRLVHQNGNIIADSGEGYASKQKATQGLKSVKNNAAGAYVADTTRDDDDPVEEGGSKATFEIYRDEEDKWRWRLEHDNGNIIADCGEGYSSKQKAKQGLQSVKQNAPGAPVEEA